MKKNIILLVLLAVIAGFAAGQTAKPGSSVVEVYYFHSARRCPTCISIEENVKKTLDTYFKDQQAKGSVKMITINIDDKKNKALVEKYEVAGSSLFVTRLTGWKTFTNDMTSFAFSYSRNNTQKFMEGLRDKINESLNK